ncbi:MAG: GNAT family N-acetyltransferase [Dehalococcoidia bacterium]|nr:GNAT family N-acetyltransferase [Dehalococcoidia bacterium]
MTPGTDPLATPLSAIEPLSRTHQTELFECREPELTEWLRRFALVGQQSKSIRVYVVHRGERVVGYYALAAGAASRATAPERISRGLPGNPIPVIVLARLAVDQTEERRGLGRALLRDCLVRAAVTADMIGARALFVDAKNEDARAFYERFGFKPSPINPLQLFLLMKDIRAHLRRD